MTLIKSLTKPRPDPGEILTEFKRVVSEEAFDELMQSVENIEEQREVVDAQLDYFLSNISDSEGAIKVIEEFYKEHHGESIDASDVDVLKQKVPDIDAILHDEALPRVSKQDLRKRFGVEGIWGVEKGDGEEAPHLVPDWVREHNKEPYTVFTTSGSTGRPWSVAVTRNDWGRRLTQITRFTCGVLEENGFAPEDTNVAVVIPSSIAAQVFSESFSYIGTNVKNADFDMLRSGSKEEKKEADRLINHVNSGKHGIIVSAISMLMQGKFGVAIRRGEVDVDVYVNGGAPLPEKHKMKLEEDAEVENYFGETEYPQAGGAWQEVDGASGFERPLEGQVNLIINNGVGYDGTGRYGYLPIGQEGQVIPGIYMSGVNAVLEMGQNKKQYLKDVNRVEDTDKGCI